MTKSITPMKPSTVHLLEQANKALSQHLNQIYSYLEDPTVQEVMINGPDDVWIERSGRYEHLSITLSDSAVRAAINILSNLNSKGEAQLIDCRLPGLRVAATLSPVATAGASMSIRRHSSRVFTLDDYLSTGSLNAVVRLPGAPLGDRPSDAQIASGGAGMVEMLKWLVRSRNNFIVSGSTSSGKTALLNALAAHIPIHDRVITIEDTAELKLSVPNRVSFEANSAYGVDIRALVRHTLRYRPNRIWVGEIRGAEAFDMLDAYNTGHPGSAVSFHSDTAAMALSRLENMIRMAPEAANWPLDDLRRQIAATFRFVIHASHTAGHRGPQELIEVLGFEGGRYQTKTLFQKRFVFDEEQPKAAATNT